MPALTVATRTIRLIWWWESAASPQTVDRVDHAGDVGEQLLPVRGEAGARAAPLEDVDSELALEVAHRLRQRGLGDVQLVGSPAEGAEAGDGGDVFELFGAHER